MAMEKESSSREQIKKSWYLKCKTLAPNCDWPNQTKVSVSHPLCVYMN